MCIRDRSWTRWRPVPPLPAASRWQVWAGRPAWWRCAVGSAWPEGHAVTNPAGEAIPLAARRRRKGRRRELMGATVAALGRPCPAPPTIGRGRAWSVLGRGRRVDRRRGGVLVLSGPTSSVRTMQTRRRFEWWTSLKGVCRCALCPSTGCGQRGVEAARSACSRGSWSAGNVDGVWRECER